MKKMMMVLAIALIAGMSQAANVLWFTGTIYVPTVGTGAFGAATGSTVAGTYNAAVTFYLNNAGAPGSAIAGVTGVSDTTTSVSSNLNGTTGAYNFLANTTYWASVYVSTAVNGAWYMQSKTVSFTMPGTGNYTLNFTSAGAMPAAWAPEPTSMALLALGAAAVGLRRRTRK
jgi:hypothetical protein